MSGIPRVPETRPKARNAAFFGSLYQSAIRSYVSSAFGAAGSGSAQTHAKAGLGARGPARAGGGGPWLRSVGSSLGFRETEGLGGLFFRFRRGSRLRLGAREPAPGPRRRWWLFGASSASAENEGGGGLFFRGGLFPFPEQERGKLREGRRSSGLLGLGAAWARDSRDSGRSLPRRALRLALPGNGSALSRFHLDSVAHMQSSGSGHDAMREGDYEAERRAAARKFRPPPSSGGRTHRRAKRTRIMMKLTTVGELDYAYVASAVAL